MLFRSNARYIVPQTVRNPVHMFFTDVENIWIQSSEFPNPNDDTPLDNKRDNLLFTSDPDILTNYDGCILNPEMNFYYNGLYQIVSTNVSNSQPLGRKPTGKYFLASGIWGDLITGTNSRGGFLLQRGPVSFGVPHFCWVAEPCDPLSNCYLECD